MILSHFSEEPLKFDSTKEYVFNPQQNFFKPVGLWLSDESSDYGWKKWCSDQEFALHGLKHETKFKVNLENILILDTPKKILDFNKKYQFNPFKRLNQGRRIINYINWEEVQKNYSGIIITPYQWTLRLDMKVFWYYGWDCASGCIWDLSKLTKINRARHIGELTIEFKPGI